MVSSIRRRAYWKYGRRASGLIRRRVWVVIRAAGIGGHASRQATAGAG
ncbi:MAG: hypothetical protein ABR521_00715 [Gaiellaceae bacterium]